MTNAPIVFLDTETDGIAPGRKVWEVAMIRRDENGERETSFFVEIDLSTADPFGLKVGRFYDRHPLGRVLSGLAEREWDSDGSYYTDVRAAHTVARWTHGAHIVGAVPNFDTEVLANLLREHGLTPAWHYHLIDVEAFAFGWLRGRLAVARSTPNQAANTPYDVDPAVLTLPWHSEEISRACGVEPPSAEERHTALGDARWAMRLFDRITGGAE